MHPDAAVIAAQAGIDVVQIARRRNSRADPSRLRVWKAFRVTPGLDASRNERTILSRHFFWMARHPAAAKSSIGAAPRACGISFSLGAWAGQCRRGDPAGATLGRGRLLAAGTCSRR